MLSERLAGHNLEALLKLNTLMNGDKQFVSEMLKLNALTNGDKQFIYKFKVKFILRIQNKLSARQKSVLWLWVNQVSLNYICSVLYLISASYFSSIFKILY